MSKLADHVFISYHGGSGGDLFAASCNGIYLDPSVDYGSGNDIAVVNTPYSIKHSDYYIQNGNISLAQACEPISYRYVSTHLFDELPSNKINIVVRDPAVFDSVINRQLWLQRLQITVDSGTFFKLIQQLCISQQFDKAAHVWFDFAYKRSKKEMLHRISSPGQQLNFDRLFDSDFVDSLKAQGWSHLTDCLQHNHQTWVSKQTAFGQQEVKSKISAKLSSMDWARTEGIIAYQHD